MKNAVRKTKNKDAEGVKFMNQYKYLGINYQNAGRLAARIDSHLKKMTKMFSFLTKNPFPSLYSRKFSNITSFHISGTLTKP
jgi:hypothetical protein